MWQLLVALVIVVAMIVLFKAAFPNG